jgi:TolA-binding protein/Flp pilus assembly protein TadD
MRPHSLFVAAALLLATPALAQQPGKWAPVNSTTLAQDYARRGEHEKVVFLFERLPAAEQASTAVFPVYIASLQALKRYKEAEKVAKRAAKLRPEEATIGVALGGVYAEAGDLPAAEKQWQKVLSLLTPAQVLPVAAEFSRRELLPWAERTYLRGRALAKNDTEYAPQLIQLYTQTQNQPQVLAETLRLVAQDEQQLPYVRNMLQNALREEKDFDALEKQVLIATQQHPEQAAFSELLLWLQVQRRDFAGALIQARALDRRGRGEGRRVMELAAIAQFNKDYESAIDGFAYVAKEYRNGPYGNAARQRLLQAREAQVRETYPVDLTKVRALVTEYGQLLAELGRTPDTAPVLRNLANLHAFQLNDRAKAMTLLQEVIDMPRANEEVVDEAKVTLGDLYLLKAEPWEATLLYSQVEKSRKDSPLGYEAKLRNARLSYYAGDFKLAQSHLDILKEATTREIANDAMQLSLLIQDNTVEDTLGLGLKAYAAVEQLVFQNKLTEAITGLDGLLEKFPGHPLADDTYYLKAQLQRRTGNFAGAAATLERITNDPKADVLSDDALFLLARIQEEDVKDKLKAQELYNQVIVKYPGSIYVAEARKRFRKLRGDGVQ